MVKKLLGYLFIVCYFFAPCRSAADNSIQALLQQLKIAKRDTNKVNTINLLARQLIVLGNYPLSDSLVKEQLDLSEELNYKKGIADAHNNLGMVCAYQGDYAHALEYLLKSLNLYEQLGDRRGQAISLKYAGTAYAREGDSADAVNYLYRALDIFKEMQDTDYIATSLISLGNLYESSGNHAMALAHLSEALYLYTAIDEKDGIASALLYMGDVYNHRTSYAEALIYYKKAVQKFKALGDKAGMATTFASLGELYKKQGDYKKALSYENKAIALAKDIALFDVVKDGELALSYLYEKQGNAMQALLHYKAYNTVRDTIFNRQSTQAAIRDEMNLEFAKKEAAQKAEAEKTEALHKAEIRKKEIAIYYISGILLLVLAFAAFAYRSTLRSRRAKKIIEQKNKQIGESISYAERIQQAMLPAKEEIKNAFPQSFVLYLPKDVVSGDFYFYHKRQETMFLAVADCTGHGIPGAFMSMVCSEKLYDVVQTCRVTDEILKQVNAGLKTSLHQTGQEGMQDGMDIALCSVVPSANGIKLNYSGANRPLWIVPKGENKIHELLPAKKSIGTFTSSDEDYSTFIVPLQQGDTFYMFTDGYYDQFGSTTKERLSVKKFGELVLSLQDKTMPEQEKELLSFFQSWKKNLSQQDDILVIGVRV